VLLQQEGQQHEQTTVVDNPPNINVATDLKRKKDLLLKENLAFGAVNTTLWFDSG